jgi:D-psicose/D-tagatose/L-ribulose 3-epimerase
MLKYGVHGYLWSDRLDQDIVWMSRKARNMGFDGLEVPLNVVERVDVPLTCKTLRDEGLDCPSCAAGLAVNQDLISDDRKKRRAGIDHLKRCVDIAHELESPRVGGVIYSAWGNIVGRGRTQDEWARCVECMSEAAEYAQGAGVTLSLEPINRFEGYFLNTVEDCIRLVDEIGLPNVDILVDTFHSNVEEASFYDSIKAAGSRLGHVHANENNRGTPGEGHVDWEGVFRALKEIGYDGYLVIESFVPDIKEIASMCAIWRPVAPDADYLAREGLRFLKGMEQKVG